MGPLHLGRMEQSTATAHRGRRVLHLRRAVMPPHVVAQGELRRVPANHERSRDPVPRLVCVTRGQTHGGPAGIFNSENPLARRCFLAAGLPASSEVGTGGDSPAAEGDVGFSGAGAVGAAEEGAGAAEGDGAVISDPFLFLE